MQTLYQPSRESRKLTKKAVKLKKKKGPSSQKFPEKISGAFARAFSYLKNDTEEKHAKL